MISFKKYKCRVCHSKEIENFKLKHFTFVAKNKNWKSFFCYNCGAVSDFSSKDSIKKYKSGNYRKYDPLLNNLETKFKNVLLPVNSWSLITFGRWRHIWTKIQKTINLKKKINMLDYGGYNGFLPYALKQIVKLNSWVADYDPKGLKMAKYLGSKVINLSKKKKIKKNFFQLITIVHVLEHLNIPQKILKKIYQSLKEKGILYIEVPNLYGFPLGDNAHLIAFTRYSLFNLLKKCGFKIIEFGYIKTPKESIKFDYYYNNHRENIYFLATKTKEKIIEPQIPKIEMTANIKLFKRKLQLSYANIMLQEVSLSLIKRSIKNFITSIKFIVYGLIEVLSLFLLNTSLINKLKK